ncbi:MAG: alcohol dehydrogenase catalytic domain-containing protein [Eubacteriaceae bacterium]
MNKIISEVMQLVKPYTFKNVMKEVCKRDNDVIVRPTLSCICAADLRYYTGNRRQEALKKKLPMALLHEGIGIIDEDNECGYRKGERVVIVPNIPGYIHSEDKYPTPDDCCAACKNGIHFENHCKNVHFLSSGFDGMLQSKMVQPALCVAKIPDEVSDEIAVLSELTTVSYNACYKAVYVEKLNSKSNVLIFGDGAVAYSLYCVLSHIFKLPKENIHVVGKHKDKLKYFEKSIIYILNQDEIPSGFSLAFECVGGKGITQAVDIAITKVKPGGMIMLMGVCEDDIPINTRDVLEKGLTLMGSSRSSRINYKTVLEHMKDEEFQNMLSILNLNNHFYIKELTDLNLAFDFAASKDYWGKVYLYINQE